MAEAAPPKRRPWPRPLTAFLLLVYVAVDAFFWVWGIYAAFNLDLPTAGKMLTIAIFLMLLVGWAWRWAVAAGVIGGRPTARFA